MANNGLIVQFFDCKLPNDGKLWKELAADAAKLKTDGVTAVWLPPAYKGAAGKDDAGYDVYDLYDLGEFNQKGSVRTKYGTKKEYIDAIEELHKKGINVYADLVLNHKLGADKIETISAQEFNDHSRYQMIGDNKTICGFTGFTFPARKRKYSDFEWNWKHFNGINWDQDKMKARLLKTDKEADFDYVMGDDIDFNNRDVYEELVRWASWYVKTTNVDGFRVDAVKDIPSSFYRDFLFRVREMTKKELFSVGEYMHWDQEVLNNYLHQIDSGSSLLDTPLHYNFHNCSKAHGDYDLRRIFDGTLVQTNPVKAVTFVDDHNTEIGQVYESWVEDWFKPSAYAIILLREAGYPSVFYGDYKGIPSDKYKGFKSVLDKLMKLRKNKAYGAQHDYIDNRDCIGWTREGDAEHKDSGLAVVISDGKGGTKRMYIGKHFAGAHFSDALGNAKYNIKIDNEGWGDFYVNRSAVAVWVRKEPKQSNK